MVNAVRSQSQLQPRRRSCLRIMPPCSSFHSHACLRKLDTAQAVQTTLKWIGMREELRSAAQACRPVFTKDLELTEDLLTAELRNIAGRLGEEN